jgi:hypothetical protein
MVTLIAWSGSFMMVGASFMMGENRGLMLAIAGLTCLTVQAIHTRQTNLIGLNIASIIGFSYTLMGA